MTERSSEGLDVRRRKLLFRAWRRGVREMDLIVGRFADAYVLEVRDFVHTILSDRAPRISGEDGLKALAIAVAAENSHRQSKPIAVGLDSVDSH